ncbi:MAG: YceH family protein [Solirubrobacteraceae bacterium]|nr:YceH family protein [Solirubrobacteraceae bacterium]
MELDAYEQRVLGCLVEKRITTPDVYPLSTNGIRTACNQSTNRDPVMHMDDEQVREACQGLYRAGLARLASGAGSRTIKYRHLAQEGLNVGEAELALIAVLLLRGPQTVGELRTRSERLYAFESLGTVTAVLDQLQRRELVELLEREPGRKEPRYAHRLGPRASGSPAVAPIAEPVSAPAPSAPFTPAPAAPGEAGLSTAELEARIAELETRVAALEELLD